MRPGLRSVPRSIPLGWAFAAALAGVPVVSVVGTRGPARADEDERPSLVRALFLERTANDRRGALALFRRVAADEGADPTTRAEGRLGAARCLAALGEDAEADRTLAALEEDETAPAAVRQQARLLRERRAAARRTAEDAEARVRAAEAVRRAEQARVEREARLEAARLLYASAARHVEERRYDRAREDLISALQLHPTDERAAALLEEISSFGDRGDLLRQAIRFVTTNRVLDFRRLESDVERRNKAALRHLRESRPDLAAATLVEAVARIDESDFYADLADARRALVVLLRKAVEDARTAGLPLPAGTTLPSEGPASAPVKAWRSEFYGLLARVFRGDSENIASIRFYDLTVPPDPAADVRGSGFASSGVAATTAPGSLRRARWVEQHVRDTVAPGSWAGRDRLLERYDDLVVVEHAPGALREVDALVGAFAAGPPAPVRVEVRVYAATSAGVADAVRALELRARPGEPAVSAVATALSAPEQVRVLESLRTLQPLAHASLRLSGRHATKVRFHEPTAACPWYAGRDDPKAPLVIPDRDATYGLDLDLYAEDLPGMHGFVAVSAVATVRRPDRPRLLPTPQGNTRVPAFLTQVVEADRRVPHAGSLALLTLGNPFKASGAAGDAGGGTHPDLVVLVTAVPESGGPVVDPPLRPAPVAGLETRQLDLGPLGDVEDEPPPDDWPSAPFSDPSRLESARRRRDAFMTGWLVARLGTQDGASSLVVSDGRVTATLSAGGHVRLAAEMARLLADASRLFTVEVTSDEVATERALAALRDAGQRVDDPGQRLWRLDEAAAARFSARIGDPSAPAGLFSLRTRLAARHTQLVSARGLRSRSIVEEFRVVRDPKGAWKTVPVNGTLEEGLVVSVRPVASLGGLATLDVAALVASVEKVEAWAPPDTPGGAPSVVLPRHRVERAGGQGTFGDSDTIVLAVPSPGSDGARTVVVRVRHVRP